MAGVTWCWRRRIVAGQEEAWIARLDQMGVAWTLTERPDWTRKLLAVYGTSRRLLGKLQVSCGGSIIAVPSSSWLQRTPAPPLRIGRRLVIHASEPRRADRTGNALVIPHGLAFGSGEHATTAMLLRALSRRTAWGRVLDLGTGSGVLALAARRFGAMKITATDFDKTAVRVARQNEARNFPRPLIQWRQADVRRSWPARRFDLVLANLYSGVLVEAAEVIAASVAPLGELWLSGVLRTQQDEVTRAYGRVGLEMIRMTGRGKWVMLQFAQRAHFDQAGGETKTT